MIRVAAVGDIHYDRKSRDTLKEEFSHLSERADLLLLAGDLTQAGYVEEAEALARDLVSARVPIFAVLGNHDFHQNQEKEIQAMFHGYGIKVLEGETAVVEVGGARVGIAGIKGFGGGFSGACVTEFGEPETKAFALHARRQADLLQTCLHSLDVELKIALMHYSPIEATLVGEKREIYPFLGSYLLAEAIDENAADAVFHGHAHLGTEKGATPAGVPVRNVALPVIRHAYHVYTFSPSRRAFRDKSMELNAGAPVQSKTAPVR
jgi:Icc-related predicted phosphoesterase